MESANSTARLWHLPSMVDDDFSRVESWVQVLTGLTADGEGNIHALSAVAWQQRRERLSQLGGHPSPSSVGSSTQSFTASMQPRGSRP